MILEHLLCARIFAVGIEEICFRALHRRDFLWIGRRRIVWADTELSPYLPYLSALTVDLELQLLRIQNDERLLFLDCITDVREHFRDTALHLRTKDAFFQGE